MDIIKDVALYLRKSRGEEDTDLDKHKSILVEMAKKSGWRYIEYLEIASSENIEFRPKFKQLLKDIQDDMFDAVLVVDYDRLGRGDLEDQALIKRIFRESQTFIITPEKLYNLIDDTDDLLVDVQGLLARQEYKAIKRRLARGKKVGARQGNWTNGTPPFPYKYDPSKKGLLVDDEQKETYLIMKQMFLNGKPFYEIAWYLNNLKKLSPRGSVWQENTIRRILRDETHMGRIISNKSEGSGHKNKKTKELKMFPREEWVIVENCHEILKSPEEHEEMLSISKARTKYHPSARRGAFILSGLLYCSKCLKAMQMQSKTDTRDDLVKACRKSDHLGNRCVNKGIKVDVVIGALIYKLKEYELQLKNSKTVENIVDYQALVDQKIKDQLKIDAAISRIKDMYEDGEYTKEEYAERTEKRKADLNKIKTEIDDYHVLLRKQTSETNDERRKKVVHLIEVLNSSDTEDAVKNHLSKEIVEKILYLRETSESTPDIQVVFK